MNFDIILCEGRRIIHIYVVYNVKNLGKALFPKRGFKGLYRLRFITVKNSNGRSDYHYANFWILMRFFTGFFSGKIWKKLLLLPPCFRAILHFIFQVNNINHVRFLPWQLFRSVSRLNGAGDCLLLCISIKLNFQDLVDGLDL